jgi:hypothetical protein
MPKEASCDLAKTQATPTVTAKTIQGERWRCREYGPDFSMFHPLSAFSRQEAFEIISAARLPLVGQKQLPVLDWLPEPESCLCELAPWEYRPDDDTKLDNIIRERLAWVDRTRDATIVNPCDVHFALAHLRHSFVEVERRLIFTKENSKLAESAAKRLRSASKALGALGQLTERMDWLWPETSAVVGFNHHTADLRRSLATLEEAERRSIALNKLITSIQRQPPVWKNREAFVRGPLSDCYWRLFGKYPGGRGDGPFARFGECFFKVIDNPIASETIARALKNRRAGHQPAARRRRAV